MFPRLSAHAPKTQTGCDVLAQPGSWLSQVTDIYLPETRAVQGQLKLKLIQKGKFTALGDKHRNTTLSLDSDQYQVSVLVTCFIGAAQGERFELSIASCSKWYRVRFQT